MMKMQVSAYLVTTAMDEPMQMTTLQQLGDTLPCAPGSDSSDRRHHDNTLLDGSRGGRPQASHLVVEKADAMVTVKMIDDGGAG